MIAANENMRSTELLCTKNIHGANVDVDVDVGVWLCVILMNAFCGFVGEAEALCAPQCTGTLYKAQGAKHTAPTISKRLS